jgi:hypothetical protein
VKIQTRVPFQCKVQFVNIIKYPVGHTAANKKPICPQNHPLSVAHPHHRFKLLNN